MAVKKKRSRQIAALWVAVVLAAVLSTQAAAEKVITLSFTGDCVIGSEESSRKKKTSFDSIAKKKGYDYFFSNFLDVFSGDDCTVINLLSVFADNDSNPRKSQKIRFRGAEDFVRILQAGSVEVVSLSNNHTLDYSTSGLNNTKQVLENAGIGWTRETDIWFLEKDGIRIAFVSMDYGAFERSGDIISKELKSLQENEEINATVFLIHEGREYLPVHQPRQKEYAELAIQKGGAELVIMHQAHVMQGIQILNNRSVFYSLGNFVYGGDATVRKEKNVNALYTMAVQVRLYFTEDGTYKGQQAILYPAYTSGTEKKNNYQPIRLKESQAEPVIEAVQRDTEWELPPLQTDENGKAYILLEYLEDREPAEETEDGAPEAAAPQPDRKNR